MKMVPFYDMYGTILGHVDLDKCRRTRYSVVVDSGPDNWSRVSAPTKPEDLSPIEIFHIPFRKVKFRSHEEEVTLYHLVVESDTIPPWFWDSKAIVDFISYSWQALR